MLRIRPLLLCALLLGSLASAAERTTSHQALRTQCLLHAADPKNPWALAHGITGLGKDFAASDGRRAADVIISDFVRKSDDPLATTYSFEKFSRDGTPVEPHSNLLTKTLVLAGVAPTTKFKAPFGTLSLQDLVDGVKRGYRHVPKSEAYWRDVAWTLDLIGATLKPGPGAVFTNGAGEQIDFNVVMEDAFAALERHEGDLLAAMDKGVPSVPKRKQGIYAHHCGGLHLVQAVMAWARHPEVRKKWSARLDRQVALMLWRVGSERPQYDAALQQAPEYKILVLTQMVKFYGHLLETTGRMRKDKVYTFSAAQKQALVKVTALLDHAVRELVAAKAFEGMEGLKKTQPQTYLDLIGDSCHASNGLELWR